MFSRPLVKYDNTSIFIPHTYIFTQFTLRMNTNSVLYITLAKNELERNGLYHSKHWKSVNFIKTRALAI